MDIAKEPAVAIDTVERGIFLELDARTWTGETHQLRRRAARVALLARFGSVDLDESYSRTSTNDQGVAVDDSLDRCGRPPGDLVPVVEGTTGSATATAVTAPMSAREDMSFADDGTATRCRR